MPAIDRRWRGLWRVCRRNAMRALNGRKRGTDFDSRIAAGNPDNATKAPAISPSSRLQLPHQATDVDQAPCLNRLAILDAPNAESFDSHVFARRLDPKKCAAMRSFGTPVIDDKIAFGHGVQTA